MNKKQENIARRHKRIRSKISGTADVPRISVYRSNKYLYVQLIDDTTGKTLASADSRELKTKVKADQAKELGMALAKKALAQKVEKAVFDRSGYLYTGKIKAVADGAREGGLKF